MQEQLTKVDEGANWFEAFIVTHPYVVAIAVALLASWVITAAFKKPLRALLPDAWQDWCIRTFDCAVAVGIALKMWPGDHAVYWALLIGFGSPISYAAVAGALIWKWPALEKYLTLRELSSSEDNINSGEAQ